MMAGQWWQPEGVREHDIPRMPIDVNFNPEILGPVRSESDWDESLDPLPHTPPFDDKDPNHRPKNPSQPFPFQACVARPVAKQERQRNPAAQQSVQVEWDKLRALPGGGAWDEEHPRELPDVVREARNRNETAHWGYLFDICVEKNSELPQNNPLRKFKGRCLCW